MRLGMSALYASQDGGTPILMDHDHTRLCVWRGGTARITASRTTRLHARLGGARQWA